MIAELIELNSNITINENFLYALESSYIDGSNSISAVYWSEKLEPKELNTYLAELGDMGVVKLNRRKNYASIELQTTYFEQRLDNWELEQFRIYGKLSASLLDSDTTSETEIFTNGLTREGFAKSANKSFTFDTVVLAKYKYAIIQTLAKGILKQITKKKIKKENIFSNPANYILIAKKAIETYIANGPTHTYTNSGNKEESRGRANFKSQSKLFNPITSKDARSLLVVDPVRVWERNENQMNDIYYFISELCSDKGTTEQDKFNYGRECYNERTLPDLDLSMDRGRGDLHELIWLERIYSKLDQLHSSPTKSVMWNVPLEVDSSMSIMQWSGAVLNSKDLLERTNAYGTELTDPWYIPNTRRLACKLAGTPMMYGSSQPTEDLISTKLKVVKKELVAINKEFGEGTFSIMRKLKDAVIKGSSVSDDVTVNINGEEFTVSCNKFKTKGVIKTSTVLWDPATQSLVVVKTSKPVLVPDYKRFKLFWLTCLIHNLDSQAMNTLCSEFDIIGIHDAAICLPGTALLVRERMAILLNNVRLNSSILPTFAASIGCNSVKARTRFMELDLAVEKLPLPAILSRCSMK